MKNFLVIFTPLYWVSVLTAYFLLSRDWAVVRPTSTSQEHLFGLLGFCVFCTILFSAYTHIKKLTSRSSGRLLLTGVPILISLFLLVNVVEHSQKSWDYIQYETAFRDLESGGNPYQSTRYLYPPVFAETMVGVYRAGTWLLPILNIPPERSALWMFVFYIHQSSLLYAVLLAYQLSLRFAGMAGLPPLRGMLFVSGLFLFNTPLLRTILYNQVNFYLLVSILVAILALARRPYLAGIAVSIGGLVKLYPFALLVPMLAAKKWKALIGAAAGSIGMIAIQSGAFSNLLPWKQFIRFYLSFPVERESAWFRNSSILSFLRNSVEFAGAPTGLLTPAFILLSLLILGWLGIRFIQRERIYVRSMNQEKLPGETSKTDRIIGHLIDFSVVSLLIAPSAWEHHFVIAMPLAIWAFAVCKKGSYPILSLALIFVFAMPVFNIFPFSYLRTAGLFVLLILVSPKYINDKRNVFRHARLQPQSPGP